MTDALRPSPGFAVVYRSGGTHDCRWTRILTTFATPTEAFQCVEGIERGGRMAYCVSLERLATDGLPVGWEPGMVAEGDDVTVGPFETRHIKAVA